MKKFSLIILITLLLSTKLKAQEEDSVQLTLPDLTEMGLTELMNLEISIASVTKLTPRESPGIVSVITQNEIKNSGAVDLQEVLTLVPGFDFGMDVEGIVGLGIRGNWAHEGKVLMLIDGHEMNEELYSTVQMGLHYPVENIERIEIIRGPGSAMYGGTAAYAVINIISKSVENFKGASASAWNSMYGDSRASSGAEVFVGNKHKDVAYSISAGASSGIRTNRTYADVYGNGYDMATNSGIKNQYANVVVDIKGYQLQAMYNNYVVNMRDAYDMVLSQAYPSTFNSWHGSITKKYKIENNLSVTPSLSYKYQSPWNYTGASTENEFSPFNIDVSKYTASVQLNYDPKKWLNLLGGAEYFKEIAQQKTGEVFFSTQSQELTLDNYAFFAQALARSKFVNFTAGCRFTQNRLYGSSFVPRAGITKAWEKLHFKALLSNAFRSPSIQNMDLNAELKPETSTIAEIEAGYRFSESMDIIVNGYDMLTKEPIVYYYNENINQDEYTNGTRSGSRGFEIECRLKIQNAYLAGNYSFYITDAKNIVSNYEVPNNHDVTLAFPAHKVSVWGYVDVTPKINIYSSFQFKGPRYGIVTYDNESGEAGYKKFNPVYTFNLMANFTNVLTRNLTLSTGIKNLFNSNDVIIQPYNNMHAPLPGSSRQYVVKAAYAINFK